MWNACSSRKKWLGFIDHTIWTRARLFFLVTLSVIAKYTARFVVQNTQIFSGSNNRGFNATEGFNGSRVASLFIYLFIYSYFFPASLLAATRCVKSSVQLSALYEIMIHRSALYCTKVFVFPFSPSFPDARSAHSYSAKLSKCTGRLYNRTQPTGMHARLYYYPTSDTVTWYGWTNGDGDRIDGNTVVLSRMRGQNPTFANAY